jgi:hypothetical protein
VDGFLGIGSFRVAGEFNRVILTLCGGGQQHKLHIGKLFRRHDWDLLSVDDGVARRHHRSPAQTIKSAGQDPGRAEGPQEGRNSDALFAPESQSFLANVVAASGAAEHEMISVCGCTQSAKKSQPSNGRPIAATFLRDLKGFGEFPFEMQRFESSRPSQRISY